MNEHVAKVMIGLSTMEHIRRAEFLPSFLALNKLANSLVITVHGQSPARSRNIIIEQALQNECTHILFVDDDMVYAPDCLEKLIVHNKDVVTALYLMRAYPHFPVFFDEAFDDGKCKFGFLTPELSGLVPIVNCGLGFVLVKTDLLKKMEKPWVTLGEIEKDGWCDDVAFFNKLRKLGAEMYCDTDVRCGHMNTMALWPVYYDGRWLTEYRNEQGNVLVPQVTPDQMKAQTPSPEPVGV